jgi:hypothetical protein
MSLNFFSGLLNLGLLTGKFFKASLMFPSKAVV